MESTLSHFHIFLTESEGSGKQVEIMFVKGERQHITMLSCDDVIQAYCDATGVGRKGVEIHQGRLATQWCREVNSWKGKMANVQPENISFVELVGNHVAILKFDPYS